MQFPDKGLCELNEVANDSLEYVLRNEKPSDEIIAWINVG